MFEAIVPISDKAKIRRNLDRFDQLLRSIILFWREEVPLRLYVVIPDDEATAIKMWVARYSIYPQLDIVLVTESEISPIITSIEPGLGVLKQMLIKLSAFQIVQGDHVLIFDSDIVVCQPFSTRDLISNGRALTEWLAPSQHEWWRESARILGYELTSADFGRSRMFVTPQILVRQIVEPLLKFVEHRSGMGWLITLVSEYSGKHPKIWTEYTLYDLFANKNDLFLKYHLAQDEMPSGSLHCLKQSIWGAKSFDNWDPGRALDGKDAGYFLVLQSITAHSLDFNLVRERWQTELRERFPAYIG